MKYLSDTGLKYLIKKILARFEELENRIASLTGTATETDSTEEDEGS